MNSSTSTALPAGPYPTRLADFGLTLSQEPKYSVNAQGRLINRVTGVPIPDAEPVFVFRGKDRRAIPALREYLALCENPDHRKVVAARIADFVGFQLRHPEALQEPDSAPPSAQDPDTGATATMPGADALLLGAALAEVLIASGMVRADAELTGARLLQFAAELASDLRQGAVQITRSAS